jgi:mono/diheme cytochrome c family protein
MKTVRTLLAFVIVLVLGAIAFVHLGIFDVAASTPDNGFVRAVLRRTQHYSVAKRARGITPPAGLDDPKRIAEGLEHYHEMCATCHGAPGVSVSEIGEGLNPEPPELASSDDATEEAGEFFWIIKNGIKMTGMPSFGASHTDDEIWSIVAFLQRMPKLTPEQYQEMVRQAGLEAPASEAIPGGVEPETGEPATGVPGVPGVPNTKHPLNPEPPPG